MNYKERIIKCLSEHENLRDDDQYLYGEILLQLDFNIVKRTALDLIVDIKTKKLPSLDTVTRIRRQVQQFNPSLRGYSWDERHGVKQAKALSDLGYATANC